MRNLSYNDLNLKPSSVLHISEESLCHIHDREFSRSEVGEKHVLLPRVQQDSPWFQKAICCPCASGLRYSPLRPHPSRHLSPLWPSLRWFSVSLCRCLFSPSLLVYSKQRRVSVIELCVLLNPSLLTKSRVYTSWLCHHTLQLWL